MKRILIAIPCMDTVACGFAQSLATLNKVGDCSVSFLVGSLIYHSRNNLAEQAIKMDADYIMWFDSDMIFEPNTLVNLLSTMEKEQADVVSGLYFKRVPPFEPVLFSELELLVDNDGNAVGCNHKNWSSDIPSEPFEVAGCGFGCVLMKTDVLFDSANAGTWFAPIGNIGEDCAFCIRAKQSGYKIICDPNVKLGHVGNQVVTDALYEAYRDTKTV